MTMKSYVPFLSSMYRDILSDISDLHPTLSKECERDLKRLLSLLETKGHHYSMVTLPAFGKHFDRCLANGSLLRSGLPGFGSFRRRGVIPRLFKGFLLRIFQENGVLKSDPDILCIRFVRQLCRVGKRFRIACPTQTVKEHVDEFIRIDGSIQSPSLDWDGSRFDSSGAFHLHFGDESSMFCQRGSDWIIPFHFGVEIANTLQRVFDISSSSLGLYNPREWTFKHGPGAVADLPRPGGYKYIFHNWSESLERVFPIADFGFANFGLWADTLIGKGSFSDEEPCSKLIAVPKTLDAPRLIASEPLSHQWCQQSIREFFYKTIARSWMSRAITFRDQTNNQKLAVSSSISGSHATIDLSQASDRISCWFVERAFRRNASVLDALQSSRTTKVRQDIDPKLPKVISLKKFSTMGSAVTFPIQSFLFLGVCLAAICHRRKITPTQRVLARLCNEVQVYGDDLVVPTDSWSEVVGILHLLGLKVNKHKTFGTGWFRESCGVEAYKGVNVTPCYVLGVPTYKRPESVISCVDSIRNFAMQGYLRTAKGLIRTLPQRFKFAAIDPDSGAFGLPDFLYSSSPVTRMNKDTQVREHRVHIPVAKQGRGPAEGGPALLQYYTEAVRAKFVQGERLGPPLRSKVSLSLRWVATPRPMPA